MSSLISSSSVTVPDIAELSYQLILSYSMVASSLPFLMFTKSQKPLCSRLFIVWTARHF